MSVPRSEIAWTPAANAAGAPPVSGTSRRVRGIVAAILVVVGSLLAPVAVVGSYVRNELIDTDRFVNLVEPLAKEAAIQDALVDAVTAEIVTLANDLQPGQVTAEQVDEVAAQVVASPQFAELWDQVLRDAHPELQQILLGRDTEVVRSSGGRVVLELGELARRVQQQLIAAGLPLASELDLSAADWDLELFRSSQLERVQDATQFVETAVPWIVAAAIASFALAIAVSAHRSSTLRWAGAGILIGATFVVVGLTFARARYLDDASRVVARDAATAAYEGLVGPLVDRLVLWIAVGAVLVVVGQLLWWWRRRRSVGASSATDHWAGRHGTELAAIAVAVGAGLLILWDDPTLVVITVTAGVVSAVAVTGLLLAERPGRPLAA